MKCNMRYLVIVLSLFAGLFLALLTVLAASRSVYAAGTVRYAKPNGLTTGNCDSWPNACTLQRALAVAANGDEIWVQAGVHYPGAAGNRNTAFVLKSGVALYGGFAGTETTRDARNWQVNRTILSGDIDQNDVTDGGIVTSTANIKGANAYHVISSTNVSNAVLDGFIVTAGQADDAAFPHDSGGGMCAYASSPTLRNVTFSGNGAGRGGGMANYTGTVSILTNVTFSGNLASEGGGMYNLRGSPALTNVTFSGNSASHGGGMCNDQSRPSLASVTFSDNRATYYGGGMLNRSFSNPTLTNVTFSGNWASEGGGMHNRDSSNPTLRNVTFRGNSAGTSGGGMYSSVSTPALANTVFSGNTASYGGGMYNYACSPELTNVTFGSNTAFYGGGMFNADSSSPRLTNVIMWGNSASGGPGIYNYESTPFISYSDVQGCGGLAWNIACGTTGGHNIDTDPRFVNAADGNLRLSLTSPCIDAGNNIAVPADVTTDLDGRPRFVDISTVPDTGIGTPPIVDMGAYEAQYLVFLPLVVRGAR